MRTRTPHLASRILDAASGLFARLRFDAVRMDDIAAEAEVSKGTLYSYFQDKNQLYQALLVRAAHGMVGKLEEAFGRSEQPREKLVAIAEAVFRYFDDEPHLIDLIQHVELVADGQRDFPWQQARDVAMRLVLETLELARARGEFLAADPELTAILLLGGLRAVIRFGEAPRDRKLAERLVDGILHGFVR